MPNAGKSNLLEALGLFGGFSSNKKRIKDFVRFGNYNELFFEENIYDDLKIRVDNSELFFSSYKSRNNKDRLNNVLYNTDTNAPFGYAFFEDDIIKQHSDFNINIHKYYYNSFTKTNEKLDLQVLDFPFGNNLVELISTNPIIRAEVIHLFNLNELKFLIDKNTNEIKLFKEYQDGTYYTLSYELIADTLQRLIFYTVAILSNEQSVLLFEEPEAHCFEPYVQELTNKVKYDKNDNQFFIVTHSDFIIQEFLRDEESRNNTNIYLVNNINGETKVKQLRKENNEDVYELGMNPFFNFESLWNAN